MHPLSPLTYYRRHKRQTLLLMGLVALMTWVYAPWSVFWTRCRRVWTPPEAI